MLPLALALGMSAAVSLALAVMLAIAWVSLGRPRHAACWSASHALTAVQVVITAAVPADPAIAALLRPVIGALVVGSGALGLIGVRRRSGDRGWIDVAGTAAIGLLAMLTLAHYDLAAQELALPGLVAAGFSIAAAAALARAPRALRPPERALIVALALLAFAELKLAFAGFARLAWPDWSLAEICFAIAYTVSLPLGTIVCGIAAVLLLADDLADDLRRVAAYDPLTGVHNRRGFADAARRAIAVAQRRRSPVAVALADVDHFKAINDRHGHSAGDATLIAIARHLSAGVRHGDIVARIGGEEFALLLVDLDAAAAGETVDRIRARLGEGVLGDGLTIAVTASFGVSAVAPGPGTPETHLAAALDRADRALYRAKTEGRDRVMLDAD